MEATREEVATHSTPASSWLIIDAQIYNISSFAAMHPGGEKIIRKYAGKDATESFYALHRHEVLDKYARLRIGSIRGESRKILPNTGNYLHTLKIPNMLLSLFQLPSITHQASIDQHKI